VESNVVLGPTGGEDVAAGGQLTDQVGQLTARRRLTGVDSQCGGGVVRDRVPVEEELLGTRIEEDESRDIERQPVGFEDVPLQGRATPAALG
jgi:hypothetical protein